MTMTLIETKTLASAAASIEFTSIPQDFTDLYVLCSLRNTGAGASDTASTIYFNGLTTNRTARSLYADGTTVSTFPESLINFYGLVKSDMTANTFSNSAIYISNYSGATNKSVSIDSVGENNGTRSDMSLTSGLWSSTAAITQITIAPTGAFTFAVGSSISLYAITKGSDGIVTTS
jgi:hypothetical protein